MLYTTDPVTMAAFKLEWILLLFIVLFKCLLICFTSCSSAEVCELGGLCIQPYTNRMSFYIFTGQITFAHFIILFTPFKRYPPPSEHDLLLYIYHLPAGVYTWDIAYGPFFLFNGQHCFVSQYCNSTWRHVVCIFNWMLRDMRTHASSM